MSNLSLVGNIVAYRMFRNLVIFYAAITVVKTAKILVVMPTPLKSHQLVFRTVIEEFIHRDHEVVVLTADPVYPESESPSNLSEINLHDLTYTLLIKMSNEFKIGEMGYFEDIKHVFRGLSEIFMKQLNDKSVLRLLSDTKIKFDLLIVANTVPGVLIFSHIFKAPVILMSPYGPLPGNMKIIGSETQLLLYPTHFQQKIYNLTIWEKIYEVYTDVTCHNIFEEQELNDDRALKSIFGVDTPTLNELNNNVHMLFMKVHPMWLHNQPVPLNVVYTWGVHKPLEKMLPNELQSFLDLSKHGVIYFSFGSIYKTSDISPEIVEIFVKIFSQLPYDILWKWDTDELPGKSQNIKISKWLPQCEVLRHPNVKIFITHGGLQSTNEAINAGVPLIGIPIFADQEYNTEKYTYFKIGIKLDYKSLTYEKFENAINTILMDYHSYKKNIIKLRTQMCDQPKPALEHVMWWIDYTLRHGGVQHLRAPAANMSWVEYYELEIILLMLSGLIGLGTVLLVAMYTCLLHMRRYINFKINQHKVSHKYQ